MLLTLVTTSQPNPTARASVPDPSPKGIRHALDLFWEKFCYTRGEEQSQGSRENAGMPYEPGQWVWQKGVMGTCTQNRGDPACVARSERTMARRADAASEQMLLDGEARSGAARGNANFAVDDGQMPTDRARADHQLRGHLRGGYWPCARAASAEPMRSVNQDSRSPGACFCVWRYPSSSSARPEAYAP